MELETSSPMSHVAESDKRKEDSRQLTYTLRPDFKLFAGLSLANATVDK